MTDKKRSDLKQEGLFLHKSIFRAACPEHLLDSYASSHDIIFDQIDPEEQKTVKYIVSHQLDVEAIELAFRHKNGTHHLLTSKFWILIYLSEIQSIYQPFFLNEKRSFFEAAVALFFATIRTPFKLVKGKFLLLRHGLV